MKVLEKGGCGRQELLPAFKCITFSEGWPTQACDPDFLLLLATPDCSHQDGDSLSPTCTSTMWCPSPPTGGLIPSYLKMGGLVNASTQGTKRWQLPDLHGQLKNCTVYLFQWNNHTWGPELALYEMWSAEATMPEQAQATWNNPE